MSSKEIATFAGKQHKHVLRDIRELLSTLYEIDGPDLDHIDLKGVSRLVDERGYTSEWHLDKDHTFTLLTGYDAKARHRVVKRWQELEKKLKAPQQPTQSLEDAVQKEVKHLRAIGLDLETAFAAATKRVADERGIEHRLLIQSDEVTGRKPGWGQLPIKGISEEEVNKIREETRHKEMIWHPREIAERFNLYDRNGKADTRLVLRILEAAGQCRIIEPVSQTIEVTSEGKDVCYTLPRPFSDGRQYGNATRWEVAYFARCYLKFIDKHSYEFVNFKTY